MGCFQRRTARRVAGVVARAVYSRVAVLADKLDYARGYGVRACGVIGAGPGTKYAPQASKRVLWRGHASRTRRARHVS